MAWWHPLWNLCYIGREPWNIGGPRPELVKLVEEGKLRPGRAIDMGCGTGDNAIYLAQQGFQVTGVDISSRAIAKAQAKARQAKVAVTLLVGDVTRLTDVEGPFALIVDNGCLHSLLGQDARDRYVQTILRFTLPGSHMFLRCFIKDPQRPLGLWRFNPGMLESDEVEHRLGGWFGITMLKPSQGAPEPDAVYLLRRQAKP